MRWHGWLLAAAAAAATVAAERPEAVDVADVVMPMLRITSSVQLAFASSTPALLVDGLNAQQLEQRDDGDDDDDDGDDDDSTTTARKKTATTDKTTTTSKKKTTTSKDKKTTTTADKAASTTTEKTTATKKTTTKTEKKTTSSSSSSSSSHSSPSPISTTSSTNSQSAASITSTNSPSTASSTSTNPPSTISSTSTPTSASPTATGGSGGAKKKALGAGAKAAIAIGAVVAVAVVVGACFYVARHARRSREERMGMLFDDEGERGMSGGKRSGGGSGNGAAFAATTANKEAAALDRAESVYPAFRASSSGMAPAGMAGRSSAVAPASMVPDRSVTRNLTGGATVVPIRGPGTAAARTGVGAGRSIRPAEQALHIPVLRQMPPRQLPPPEQAYVRTNSGRGGGSGHIPQLSDASHGSQTSLASTGSAQALAVTYRRASATIIGAGGTNRNSVTGPIAGAASAAPYSILPDRVHGPASAASATNVVQQDGSILLSPQAKPALNRWSLVSPSDVFSDALQHQQQQQQLQIPQRQQKQQAYSLQKQYQPYRQSLSQSLSATSISSSMMPSSRQTSAQSSALSSNQSSAQSSLPQTPEDLSPITAQALFRQPSSGLPTRKPVPARAVAELAGSDVAELPA